MRKIVGKVGNNIFAFTSHFADLTLALCPLGWGLTRRFPFSWQTLYLPLLSLKRTPFVAIYLNATVKISTLYWWTCIFTRFHGATQRPGSGDSSGAGRYLLTSHLFFVIFSPVLLSPVSFSEDAGDTFTCLSIAGVRCRCQGFSEGNCLNNEPHLPQHWRLFPHAELVRVWWFFTVTTP